MRSINNKTVFDYKYYKNNNNKQFIKLLNIFTTKKNKKTFNFIF